jgi:hypothetical protein
LGDVCHVLMVVSNCMPGSAHCHADSENCRMVAPGYDGRSHRW